MNIYQLLSFNFLKIISPKYNRSSTKHFWLFIFYQNGKLQAVKQANFFSKFCQICSFGEYPILTPLTGLVQNFHKNLQSNFIIIAQLRFFKIVKNFYALYFYYDQIVKWRVNVLTVFLEYCHLRMLRCNWLLRRRVKFRQFSNEQSSIISQSDPQSSLGGETHFGPKGHLKNHPAREAS